MLTCPLLALLHCVDRPAVLLAMLPLPLIRLPTGKQVGSIPMRHIRVTLPQVPVPIGEAVSSEAMPETSAVLASIVAVVCALLHAQTLADTPHPFPLIVVPVVVLADAEAMSAASVEVAMVCGSFREHLASQAMVHTSLPLQQFKEGQHDRRTTFMVYLSFASSSDTITQQATVKEWPIIAMITMYTPAVCCHQM